MSIGKKLYELRKQKGLSQEEVADKLNVSRQTVSKWETDQSMPDFDKIVPICELYSITADELLMGIKKESEQESESALDSRKEKEKGKRAFGIGSFNLLFSSCMGYDYNSCYENESNCFFCNFPINLRSCYIHYYLYLYGI